MTFNFLPHCQKSKLNLWPFLSKELEYLIQTFLNFGKSIFQISEAFQNCVFKNLGIGPDFDIKLLLNVY